MGRRERTGGFIMTYALIIHGGAGAQPGTDYSIQKDHMETLILKGQSLLEGGANALDVVEAMVCDLERSGHYVAGKGSAPNMNGAIELDASIMDGTTRRAGSVAAIPAIEHPVSAARKVMDDGKHVMMAGVSALNFAVREGLKAIDNPEAYYTEHERHGSGNVDLNHGTVGAVALDLSGNLAAATSTGGIFGKSAGRIGDTPIIGAGTWADGHVAVSSTGLGEAFIRTCAAHDVAARMKYGSETLSDAAWNVLDQVALCEGDGGLIAIDKKGNIVMPFNSDGMKRAAVSSTMTATVRVFETEPR